MKRFLASFLAFVLITSMVPFGFATTQVGSVPTLIPITNHEIWGIPWGISMDEFIEIAYQNTGIVFEPYINEDGTIDSCLSTTGQDIVILGHDAIYVTASFSKETQAYQAIHICFINSTSRASGETFISFYESLAADVSTRYGQSSLSFLSCWDEKNEPLSFPLPWNGSQLDTDQLLAIMNQNPQQIAEQIAFMQLETYFNNIMLFGTIGGRNWESLNGVSGFQSALIAFDSTNAPYPTPLLGDITEYLQANPASTPTPTPPPTPTPTPLPTPEPTKAPIVLDF